MSSQPDLVVAVPTPEFETYRELWEWLYEAEAPEQLEVSVRAWQARGISDEAIDRALIAAAERPKVAYEDKLSYVGGILRNWLLEEGDHDES